MEALIGMLVLTFIFWAGVLISYRSTVKKHLYIPVITFGFILIALFFPLPLGLIMLGSAVWMAYDLRKLEAHKYPLRGLTHPATAVLACVLLGLMVSFMMGLAGWLLWIVPFTWHLANRCMILDGAILQKKKYRKNHRSSAKSNRAVEQRPVQAIDASIPHSETQGGDKVRIMDVIVEDVEVEAADDEATFPDPSPPARKSGLSGLFGDEFAATVKRNWRNVKYIVGFIIVVVVIWMIWAERQKQAEWDAYAENWRKEQRQREIEQQQADYQGRAYLQQLSQQHAQQQARQQAQQQARQQAQQQMEQQARLEAMRQQQAKASQQISDMIAQQKEAQQRQAQQEAQQRRVQQEAQQRWAQQERAHQEAQRMRSQMRCLQCNGTGFGKGGFNCISCDGTGRR